MNEAYCACGCGEPVTPGKKWRRGHHWRDPLDVVRRHVRSLDRNVEYGSEEFNAAVLLLSMLREGTNPKRLCEFTRLPVAFVTACWRRLWQGQVIHRGKINADWFASDGGDIAFWCDVLVALGIAERVYQLRQPLCPDLR